MAAIQVKDVPDEVRDILAAEAKRSGQSLQAYVLSVLEREARFARNREIAEQTPLPGANLSMDEIVAAVRAARGDEVSGGDGESGAA
ncbi:FitA-like ribbon-helix-helix domain-containing protein [Nocardiopsis sp. NPDC050513]|uniref:FitA-like ribbon-helix-helix domain-containing protein n=1 Tax=Nocardiopsis sp. NPDC050513 TaxID=3364338 RepID=UPI003797C534